MPRSIWFSLSNHGWIKYVNNCRGDHIPPTFPICLPASPDGAGYQGNAGRSAGAEGIVYLPKSGAENNQGLYLMRTCPASEQEGEYGSGSVGRPQKLLMG